MNLIIEGTCQQMMSCVSNADILWSCVTCDVTLEVKMIINIPATWAEYKCSRIINLTSPMFLRNVCHASSSFTFLMKTNDLKPFAGWSQCWQLWSLWGGDRYRHHQQRPQRPPGRHPLQADSRGLRPLYQCHWCGLYLWGAPRVQEPQLVAAHTFSEFVVKRWKSGVVQ